MQGFGLPGRGIFDDIVVIVENRSDGAETANAFARFLREQTQFSATGGADLKHNDCI